MAILDYHFDDDKRVVINNDINYMYRYPDFTEHVVFIYEMMNMAVSDELISEILLLMAFDQIKRAINAEADVPNHRLDTLVSILISRAGRISKAKRPMFLEFLGERELDRIQSLTEFVLKETKDRFHVDLQALMITS